MLKIEKGQEYKRHNEFYTVEFANEDIVLLQYQGNNHRLENRSYFEACVNEGYFESQQQVIKISEEKRQQESTEEQQEGSEEISHEDIAWLGEKGEESLRKAGLVTASDIERASDDRILSCSAVGEKALSNIRDWVEEQ